MCFYNNCEWHAEVYEIAGIRTEKPRRCYECGDQIQTGDWCETIYQQEHAECQICQDYDDYVRCVGCAKILIAVEQVEKEEGRPSYAQLPSLEGLWLEALYYDYDYRYTEKALEMFPELVEHRLMDRVTR